MSQQGAYCACRRPGVIEISGAYRMLHVLHTMQYIVAMLQGQLAQASGCVIAQADDLRQ